jgi:hypothetical protein
MLTLVTTLSSQTRIDLQSQSKTVDFSSAQSTKPMKSGSILPGVCSTGEMYFLLSAVVGQNIYTCIAQIVWAAQGGMVADATGSAGQLLTNSSDGTQTWSNHSGDLSGGIHATVTGIQGRKGNRRCTGGRRCDELESDTPELDTFKAAVRNGTGAA